MQVSELGGGGFGQVLEGIIAVNVCDSPHVQGVWGSGTRRVDITRGSDVWQRVQQKLQQSLQNANMTRLERVQNPQLWGKFLEAVSADVRDSTRLHSPGSRVRELWHVSSKYGTDAISGGDVGFDLRRAHPHGFRQAVKDIFRAGGHVYGYGAYFATHAIYSHWWSTRHWHKPKKKPGYFG